MPSSSLVCLTQMQLVICVLHLLFFSFFLFLSPFLVPFKHFDKFNPSCVDVFDAGRGKNCFLSPSLWRGVHCDKSDSLIEQPSGLLDYFAAVWLATHLWTADWLPFGAADRLIGLSALFAGCKPDDRSVCLESGRRVTGYRVISSTGGHRSCSFRSFARSFSTLTDLWPQVGWQAVAERSCLVNVALKILPSHPSLGRSQLWPSYWIPYT